MPALYANAFALVQPSTYEGYGLPVAEAMAAGLPVVAAPAAATLEILNGCGQVARGWTAEDLHIAIEALIAWSPEKRQRRVSRAKAIAGDRYRWARTAELLREVFLNTLVHGISGGARIHG
jgi:alpha-1,3-rhamnosyl/mannosyltransferase